MDELNQIIEIEKEVSKAVFNIVNLILGGLLSIVFFITGGQDELVATLAIVMLTDYISGIIKSIITEKTNSRIGIKGALKSYDDISFNCSLEGRPSIKRINSIQKYNNMYFYRE